MIPPNHLRLHQRSRYPVSSDRNWRPAPGGVMPSAFELFKTSVMCNATATNPHGLGHEPPRVQQAMPQ
jgi:hypothetical protein